MMEELKLIEDVIVARIENLQDDIEAIQQPRSDFALEHFVVGQHDMPGRQRMQAVLELQIKMFNIRRAQLEERKLLVEVRKQENIHDNGKGDEIELAEIEIERIEMDLAEMRLARKGAIREAQCLLAILDKLPKYTYEQLQAEEAAYWQARLSRQAMQDMRSIGTIGQGNVDAISQMFRKVGEAGLSLPLDQLEGIAKLGE